VQIADQVLQRLVSPVAQQFGGELALPLLHRQGQGAMQAPGQRRQQFLPRRLPLPVPGPIRRLPLGVAFVLPL